MMEDPFNESLLKKMESMLTSTTTTTTTVTSMTMESPMTASFFDDDDPATTTMMANVTEMIFDAVLSTLAPNATRNKRKGGPFK